MKELINCPLCGSTFNGYCSKPTCELYNHFPEEYVSFFEKIKKVLRRIRFYFKYPKDIYYDLRGLCRRKDLVRTGLSKYQWYDTDTILETAMIKLFCDFMENDNGLKCFYDAYGEKIPDKENEEYPWYQKSKEMVDLYVDIKYHLPKMQQKQQKTFDEYTDSFDIDLKNGKTFNRAKEVLFEYYLPKEEVDKLRDTNYGVERDLDNFMNDILYRIVTYRTAMWS